MAQQFDEKRLQELARKYLKGTISPAEQQEFDQWFLEETIDEQTIPLSEDEHRRQLLARIHQEAGLTETPVRRLWPRIAAASLLLMLGFGR
jgi:hypothetical protein